MTGKNNRFGVYLTDVLKEMCRRVGADFDKIDFTKDKWYEDYSWSQSEEDQFVEWFARFLRNMGPRRELCTYPPLVRTKAERTEFARKFISEFSWLVV